MSRTSDNPNSITVNPKRLLIEYFLRGLWWKRVGRVFLMLMFLGVFVVCLSMALPLPTSPARGDLARIIDKSILVFCICAFFFLTFYVFDAINMALRIIKGLGQHRTNWPESYIHNIVKQKQVNPEYLAGYADVYFTAMHTKEVSSIVYYPFLIVLLMVIARNEYFENWPWPASLLIMLIISVMFIWFCSFCIRRAARHVKREALKDIDSHMISDTNRRAQIEHIRDEINSISAIPAPPENWLWDRV